MTTASANLTPLYPPVEPSQYLQLFVSLLSAGVLFTAWFFSYMFSHSAKNRSLIVELILALIASALVGVGFLFLLLWARIWI